MKKDRETRWTRIPIYGNLRFKIMVSDDIGETVRRITESREEQDDYAAIVLSQAESFWLIFSTDCPITHNTVAHEVYHVVGRIGEYVGFTPSKDNHEPYAYLQGWVAQKVYDQLKSWKIKPS